MNIVRLKIMITFKYLGNKVKMPMNTIKFKLKYYSRIIILRL